MEAAYNAPVTMAAHHIPQDFKIYGCYSTRWERSGANSVPMKDVSSVSEKMKNNSIIRASALGKLSLYGTAVNWCALTSHSSDKSPLVRITAARSFVNLPPQSLSTQKPTALGKALRKMQKSLVANADHPNTQMFKSLGSAHKFPYKLCNLQYILREIAPRFYFVQKPVIYT